MRQAKQVEQAYRDLLQAKGSPIKEKSVVLVAVKWAKATNDLALAQGLLKLSTTDALKCQKSACALVRNSPNF